MDEEKPAFCIRKEDLKPFVGLDRYAQRVSESAKAEQLRTDEYCGWGSEYNFQKEIRAFALCGYNLLLTGALISGAVGLVKLVEQIIK